MRDIYYHGRGVEGLRDIAETGRIKGSLVKSDELFPELRAEIGLDYEKAVWITKDRECAEVYGWGGGYLELDCQDLNVIEDPDSCYSVLVRDELPIDHVERIMVEEKPSRNRDLTLEIADLLSEEHLDIPIGSYRGKRFEVAPQASD